MRIWTEAEIASIFRKRESRPRPTDPTRYDGFSSNLESYRNTNLFYSRRLSFDVLFSIERRIDVSLFVTEEIHLSSIVLKFKRARNEGRFDGELLSIEFSKSIERILDSILQN